LADNDGKLLRRPVHTVNLFHNPISNNIQFQKLFILMHYVYPDKKNLGIKMEKCFAHEAVNIVKSY